MALRRGFAAQAERLSASVRADLGIDVDDRLDPQRLADDYGVPVVPLTELASEGADPRSIYQLTVLDRGCFSAGTVLAGTSRLIVFNPGHAGGRRANSVTHELSHLLLEHEAGPAIGPGGCRVWDQDVEDEADLLAATLLVPRDAALACARAALPHVIGAAHFGVSADLMRWRTEGSGAARQAEAAPRRSRRTLRWLSQTEVASVRSRCDLSWLQDLTASEWRIVLADCGRAISTGSVPALMERLARPG